MEIVKKGDSLEEKINDGVKIRLIRFLQKDKIGIRKSLMWFFLQTKNCTTIEIYNYLIKQGFNVNYRAVSSMVGQMHSRLGILRFNLINKHNVYSLKEDYLDIVKMILTLFSSRDIAWYKERDSQKNRMLIADMNIDIRAA